MRRVNLAQPAFAFDPEDPAGFRAGVVRPGPELGAHRTGVSLYELPPGEALCPYHYEHAEEEWLLALDAGCSVRTPDGTRRLAPLDLVFFPPGPEGAHQVRNDSAEAVRVLMVSERAQTAATVYPDSGKVGVYTEVPGEERRLFRIADAVDYYEGEENR